jgi:hypothetical protein
MTGEWDGICDLQFALKYRWGTPNPTDRTSPAIVDLMPADSSITGDATPMIGANYSDPSGIDTTSVFLEVDGLNETSSSDVQSGRIEFVPGTPISDGPHTVYLEVRDMIGNLANATWGFTANVLPTISNLSPGDGATTNDATPKISANYDDNTAIDETTVRLKVDGAVVTPTFLSESRVEYQQLSTLPDGGHTVVLEVNDTSGNQAVRTWSFTIHTSVPLIDNLFPTLGSETSNTRPTISAQYSDPAGINVASVLITINGTDVTSQAEINQTVVSYTPSAPLSDGTFWIYVEVKDTVGNLATVLWNFTVNTSIPGDIDKDGLPDSWEIEYFGNLSETGSNDTDNDGLTNFEEFDLETDPSNPDSDGDGISDGDEVEAGTDPLSPEPRDDFLSKFWWVLVIGVVIIVFLILYLFFPNLFRFGREKKARRKPAKRAKPRVATKKVVPEVPTEEPPPPPLPIGTTEDELKATEAAERGEILAAEASEGEEVLAEGEPEGVVEEVAVEGEPDFEEVVDETIIEEEPTTEEAIEPEVKEEIPRKPLPLPPIIKKRTAEAEKPEEVPEPEKVEGITEVSKVEKVEEPEEAKEVVEAEKVEEVKAPEEEKEPDPLEQEKARLKKITEEIDNILEFDDGEPLDDEIRRTIKDVPKKKKKL